VFFFESFRCASNGEQEIFHHLERFDCKSAGNYGFAAVQQAEIQAVAVGNCFGYIGRYQRGARRCDIFELLDNTVLL